MLSYQRTDGWSWEIFIWVVTSPIRITGSREHAKGCRPKVKTIGDSGTNISQHALNIRSMSIPWCIQILTDTVNCIGNIRSRARTWVAPGGAWQEEVMSGREKEGVMSAPLGHPRYKGDVAGAVDEAKIVIMQSGTTSSVMQRHARGV
jgi:hypothetical protein